MGQGGGGLRSRAGAGQARKTRTSWGLKGEIELSLVRGAGAIKQDYKTAKTAPENID